MARHQLKSYTDAKFRIVPSEDDVIDHLRSIGTDVQAIARALQAAIVSNHQGAMRWLEGQFGLPWVTIASSITTRTMAQYFHRFGVPVDDHRGQNLHQGTGHNHLGSHRRHHPDDDHHDRHGRQAVHRHDRVPPAVHHHVHHHQTLHLHNHYDGSSHHSGRRGHNIGGEHYSHRSRQDREESGFERTSHRKHRI